MKDMIAFSRRILALVGLCAAMSTPAFAQWPERPIRIVVPYPAGAAGDLVIRHMQPMLQARLGQALVIENKSGAGGNIGTMEVVRAKPDGYTLVLGATNNFVINQFLYKSMAFDPLSALQPIVKLVNAPSVLFIHSDVPARTYREFAQYASSQPGKLNYGSPGSGTAPHLSAFALSEAMGARMTHVAYRGAKPGVAGLLGNEVQMFLVGYGVAGAHLASGRIRALAVASNERLKELPDVPTMAEAGAPDVVRSNWWALAAPKGTDAAIIQRLADEVRAVLAQPATQQFLSAQGFIPSVISTEAFAQQLTQEAILWRDIVAKSGVTVD